MTPSAAQEWFMRRTDTVYRGHNPKWSHDPVSGDGAKAKGGRFNRPGIACLYTSVSPETAWLEAQAAFPFKAQPLTLCAYDVDCASLADLTKTEVRNAFDIALGDLACPWEDLTTQGIEPPSWRIADRLIEAGAAGAIVPSFAIRADIEDVNVVFWKWSARKPHSVRVIDDFDRLPKNAKSWR